MDWIPVALAKAVERKPQHLSKQRAGSANPATVEEYFKKVEKLMDELGIKDSEDLDRRVCETVMNLV